MQQKQEHTGKRILGMLLAFALMISLVGGTGLTVQAADANPEESRETVVSTAEDTGEDTGEEAGETEDETLYDVCFSVSPENAVLTVSKGLVYTYVEDVLEGSKQTGSDETEGTDSYVYSLPAGNYTATIHVQESGWYASQFSFKIAEDGTITSSVSGILSDNVFSISLDSYPVSSVSGAWDGITLDVSWYTESATDYYISTAAQFAGLAAIVNGLYNAEILYIIDDQDGDGVTETYTPRQYAALDGCKIRPTLSSGETGGSDGYSTVTTSTYWYGAKSDGTQSDFNGKNIYLTGDIDMGGTCIDGTWTGPRYMPVAGQWTMNYASAEDGLSDAYSRLDASFNGRLYGQGHIVANLYGDRYVALGYGHSQSVGLIGRLGNNDSDAASLAAVDPTVSGVAISGYINGRRSVGGIVGKIGQTSAGKLSDGSTGAILENCLNFASVNSSDSKGCGGIVGAGWNSGEITNCANFGAVSSSYSSCPVGGISGSNEIAITNCYNAGQISAAKDSYAMAIGTRNSGSKSILNCYWLTGTAAGGGYYGSSSSAVCEVYEVTDNYNDSELTASAYMQSAEYLSLLNGTDRIWVFADSSDAISGLMSSYGMAGYPVPRVFTTDTSYVTEVQVEIDTDTLTTEYLEDQTFDTTGVSVWAYYSDNTKKELTDYTVSLTGALTTEDTSVTISGTWEGISYSRTIPITVSANSVSSIVISTAPTNTLYASDEIDAFSTDGMVVQAYYASAPDTAVTLDSDEYTWERNGTTLTVSYTYAGVTVTDSLEITILSSAAPTADEEGYYEIGNEDGLLWFANQVNALGNTGINGKLTADLSPSSDFTGIGSLTAAEAYSGSFDGDGHTVTLSVSSDNGAGLFIGINGATIGNVTIAGTVESTYGYAAGLVGYIVSGENSISNCVNRADITVTGSKYYAGGIIGTINSSVTSVTVENCVNEGSISGYSLVGGIAGYIVKCNVSECYNYGAITATGTYAGGIVAEAYGSSGIGEITDCGNEGTVTGVTYVGGITGYPYRTTSTELTLDGLYNTGAVSGTSYVGGIVGRNRADISNVYNTGAVSGTSYHTGGIVGSNYLKATVLSNAYNAGEVTYTSSDVTYEGGLLVGCITGTSYVMYVENVYYLSSLDGSAVASGSSYLYSNSTQAVLTNDELAAMAKTSDELAALADTLGDSFVTNTNSEYHQGYPILTWEDNGASGGGEAEEPLNGLYADEDGTLAYYVDGVVDTTYTGIAATEDGTVYYVESGHVGSYTGLAKDSSDGIWYYFTESVLDEDYTGPVKNAANGCWYYVSGGTIDWNYTGLAKNAANGIWYYFAEGALDWSYSGAVKHSNGVWYYVSGGQLDWNYTGTATTENGTFTFKNGSIVWS